MTDQQKEPNRDTPTPTEGLRADRHSAPAPDGATVPGPSPAGPPPRGSLPPAGSGRRRGSVAAVVAAALVAGVAGGAGGFTGAYALFDGHGSAASGLTVAAPSAAPTVSGTVTGAAAAALPSAVDIQVPQSQGSDEGAGVILTAGGDVLTNNHVVARATGPITVTLADGSQHQATVVGTSPSYDLAVLQVRGVSGLRPATLASNEKLQVGQTVVAIGSPEGLSGTVTSGIISAFNRTVAVQADDGSTVVYNGLQTDAPINPGNSGGPLVDLQGQVVGIDSAIASTGSQSGGQSGSIGLGFAIPVAQAQRVAQQLMSSGVATKPVLGVQGNAASASGKGAQIAAVEPGSPAATAGLVAGDVVTRVDNAQVADFADLVARIGAHAPGDTVTLTIGSGGSPRTVRVTLGSTPDTAATTSSGGQSVHPFGRRRN